MAKLYVRLYKCTQAVQFTITSFLPNQVNEIDELVRESDFCIERDAFKLKLINTLNNTEQSVNFGDWLVKEFNSNEITLMTHSAFISSYIFVPSEVKDHLWKQNDHKNG